MLPADEIERLERLQAEGAFTAYEITPENSATCVVLRDYRLPAGLSIDKTDMLLRLPPGFPDAVPDMFWCDPPVSRADGGAIPQADQYEPHLGRNWQRFSRHLAPGEWRPGTDSLDSFLVVIRKALSEGIAKAA